MKNSLIFLLAAALLTGSCSFKSDYTSEVDPLIGSGGTGHVFVGASVPWGLVQLGPTNQQLGWDFCSGYNTMDSVIIGFSHTHLSGTGMPEFCDITVMPAIGSDYEYSRGVASDLSSGPFSVFRHETEVSEPGYYSVMLDRYGIQAELTATHRVGMHRYTFPEAEHAAIIFDLENGSLNERLTGWHIEAEGDRILKGYRWSTVWADRGFSIQDGQKVFFTAEFSKPFESFTTFKDGKYGRAEFKTKKGEEILLKVGISVNSIEAAEKNLIAEVKGWDFDSVRKEALAEWNKQLSRLDVKTDNQEARNILYTSLYHTMIFPNDISDFGEEAYFTNFSFWDTYRAQMPLYSILLPDVFEKIAISLLRSTEKSGKVPVWPMMGIETDCMIGNPGIPVLADGVLKGFIKGDDAEKAFELMKKSAMLDERWQGLRKKHGYIPYDITPRQSVAYECEYALADWSVAQVAKMLGKEDDYAYFMERSHSWTKLYDPSSGFIRPKDKEGKWVEPFDPLNVDFGNDYCEGNAWQYSLLVPHDIDTLITLMGSKQALLDRLDTLFTMSSEMTGHSSDATGTIGQYVHGNEPSHHIIWIYSMLGHPEKASALTHKVLNELYAADADGICGNEDMGQMSAWYILASMGLYQVEPSGGRYFIAEPFFPEITVNYTDGRNLTILKNEYKNTQNYTEYIDIMEGRVYNSAKNVSK